MITNKYDIFYLYEVSLNPTGSRSCERPASTKVSVYCNSPYTLNCHKCRQFQPARNGEWVRQLQQPPLAVEVVLTYPPFLAVVAAWTSQKGGWVWQLQQPSMAVEVVSTYTPLLTVAASLNWGNVAGEGVSLTNLTAVIGCWSCPYIPTLLAVAA